MRELTTERLRLRAFTDDDLDFVHELHTHPGVARFIPKQVATDRAAALAQTRRFQTLAEHPVHGFYCATLRETSTPVAMIMCKPIPASAGVPLDDVEIGWRQHPDHGGRGYASEAAAAVLAHALASGLPRVVAVTDPENTGSMRICERIGMTHRGRTRDYYDAECELFVADQ
ncbi:RimJ/RimL family protein N-acetyltransferase [Propionibacteriaceae bacterium ES.041]|uniref:GNAT family N-acetyltransferase n=1 Tax=Enemella evansiae TaxID=2016499 RepID=UPI000B96636D|nr:GNAT family N-acetyltransferase [Enemella evansiae]OYN94595.1 GNAT family N-acetyltransferase [Enemella evansiae]PFG67656.1 RimJ/RimL family protein N-acetyltransferase [Propionibacteriaceae bacterium ES.041]